MEKIRNFVIIAHIDHGKSTLADRMLEVTGTVPPHKMKAQYLDALDLERERGITIKMAPVRMNFEGYILNLIDTPGHSDFSYEVSRSLKAVEGAVLLVDATQGIQAQTLANLENAQKAELLLIGAVSKIDIASSEQVEQAVKDLADLLKTGEEEIFKVSGKSGEGVRELLRGVIRKFPDPKETEARAALVFSSLYDEHKGVLAFVRVFNGVFRTQTNARLIGVKTEFKIKEIGFFKPELKAEDVISSGEIGYIATGIKDPGVVRVGDTIGEQALPGFQSPSPVVFVALYPDEGDDYENLKVAIYKLRLHDSSFSIIPTTSDALGRGFQCGFLGRLHFEIVTQRLEREFNIKVVNSFPSVAYKVKNDKGEWRTIENPKDFPDDYAATMEPMVKITILSPMTYLGSILKLKDIFRMSEIRTETRGERVILTADLPLSDLISDFDDRIKSVSSGFASFSYKFSDYRLAKVKRLDVTVAGDAVPGLSRVVFQDDVESVARKTVERLKELLPKQQFTQAIQASASGRIVARETIPAMKKNLGDFGKNGGDRTRKMKLWKKQKEGKKRLKEAGRVSVSPLVFKELLKR